MGALIALDVIPIGTPGLHLKNLYFAEALAGIEDIGAYGNGSIEKIIDLQPDLIITSENDETKYNLLSKAAPTISVPYGQLKNAHEELNYFGELLGREAEAKAWLADYDERVAQAKAKVDKAIPRMQPLLSLRIMTNRCMSMETTLVGAVNLYIRLLDAHLPLAVPLRSWKNSIRRSH